MAALILEQPIVRKWWLNSRSALTREKAKQCYHCQGLGHVQADCPTLRISGGATSGRCYSCGQPGHVAVRCTVVELRTCRLT